MAVRKMIMGRKVGMTQLFAEDGRAIPVTVLEVGPCYVVQQRTEEKDGYQAIQLGYLPYEEKDLRRAKELHSLHERRRTNTDESGKMKDRSKVDKEPRGPHRLTLAAYGHFLKHNVPPLRYLKEFRVAKLDDYAEGAELRADIYKPYFTTRAEGTGLGLSVVRQIVLAHHWDIDYIEGLNGGAGFRISGLKVI
jgi:large subunit ribosomal protein L3